MASTTEIKIDKLTSDNYFKWKGELKCALCMRGLWDAVEENEQYEALQPAARTTMNQKAFFSHLHDNAIGHASTHQQRRDCKASI